MADANRFEVDIPVTNLDESDDDDFIVTRGGSDGLFAEDNYDIDNDSLNLNDLDEPSIVERLKARIQSFLRPQGKNGFEYFGESIEMRDRSRSLSSFASSEGYGQFTGGLMVGGAKKKFTKVHFHLLLFGFVTSLMILSVWLTRNRPKGLRDKPEGNTYDSASQRKALFSNGTHPFYATTIFISLDGFHPHYISAETTPFLHDLLVKGYGAPYMIPSFPSSTFPNHWTLATGLYPSEHGIVGNTFYDPASKRQFINTKPDLSLLEEWWGGEPLWQTAASQGVSSAVHMWPGSEVPFTTGEPLIVDKYNGSEVLSVKVDRILDWLDLDISKRPELIMSYVPTIDSLGHKYGIAGEELEKGLRYVDSFLDSIYMGLVLRNLTNIVNFVVVSDHGMSPTSNNRLIYLDDLVEMKKIEHMDGWPLFGLRPFAEYSVDDVYAEIQRNYKDNPDNTHFKVYKRQELPQEWKFGYIENEYTTRIAPIWVVPDIGYTVTTHAEMKRKGFDYHPLGIHGYNNTEVLMRALFLGYGPFFEQKLGEAPKRVQPFQNTEVYNIICESLDLVPSPNNGTGVAGSQGFSSYLSTSNLLDVEWQDVYDYPNVSFEHDITLLRENATYDKIWRLSHANLADAALPENPTSSLISSESAFSTFITPESVPDPSYYSSISADETSSVAPPVVTDTKGDSDDEDDSDSDDDHDDDDDDNDDDDDDDDDDDEKKGKDGLLGFLDDVFDDLEDAVDDFVDSVEDKYNHVVHGGDDGK